MRGRRSILVDAGDRFLDGLDVSNISNYPEVVTTFPVASLGVVDTVTPQDLDQLSRVAAMLKQLSALSLAGPDHKQVPLPENVRALLSDVVTALMSGDTVAVLAGSALVTTQQAAEYLGVSRPTVVKLLEGGQIAFSQPGRHRRIEVKELIEYQRRIQEARARTLDELTQRETEGGLRADTFVETR